MAGSVEKKKNNVKFSGEKVRFIIYILLAAVCVALFLIFGRSNPSAPASANASPSPVPEPSGVPKGVPMGKFISALDEAWPNCGIGEVSLNGSGMFEYPLALPDGREGARLLLKTDSIGRVTECTIELPYIYAGEPDSSYSEITASAIKAEYRKREKADTALVSAFLECIYAQLADDLNISTIDGKKIDDAIEKAYYSLKTYDKKAGSARFYCETETAEDTEFFFTFRVIASFNYSK